MTIFPAINSTANLKPVTRQVRDQVEDLLIDYVHALDDFDLKRWPDFFTKDAVYQIIPRESYDQKLPLGILFCEGHGMMRDRIMALETANIFEPHSNNHILSRPQLSQNGNGTITARSNFNVIRTMQDGRMEIYAAGKYLDIIVADETTLLLKDRRVIIESRCIDTLLVYPL